MMRYQRVSPEGLPSSNGNKKSNLRTTTTCKKDINGDNGRTIPNRFLNSTTSFESKPFRFRSPSRTQDVNEVVNGAPGSPSISDHQEHHASPSPSRVGSGGGGGDVLLQWGIKKRARVSRSEIRSPTEDESSSSSAVNKVQRRVTEVDKMLPPPPPQQPPTSAASNSRVANPRTEDPLFPPNNHRKLEGQSATGNGSLPRSGGRRSVSRTSAAVKRSPPAMEKLYRKMHYSRSAKDEKINASTAQAAEDTPAQSERGAVATNTNTNTGLEKKGSVEVIEWPRIYISLSRKEKEEDFLAMKGTKLPHRPKKRAKNVDKTLQYCFPGIWLSDLTKSRYEVREKKSVKKQKRRGLKGLGSMDSDSE